MDTQEQLAKVQGEKTFIVNWLTDLLDTMDAVLDEATKLKLIEGCGRRCFERHSFKTQIAEQGKGDLAKLIAAYRSTFEIWQEGDQVHIRYGEVSPGCYCPVGQNIPVRPGDLHCECTRMTHQSIFETALGLPFKVELVETVRRGGKTCHLIVNL